MSNLPGSRGIDFAGIRAAHPIAETVGRYLELKQRGGELLARCPFHNDAKPSFAVVPSKGKAFCNACGWAGDVIDFVAEFEGCDIPEAARRLSGDQLPDTRPAPPILPPDESEAWVAILPAPADAPAYDPAHTYNPRAFDKRAGKCGKAVNWQRSLVRCDAYLDADRRVLGYVVRMEIDGSKLTPTVVFAEHRDGRRAWVSGKFPNPRPLQGLHDLAERPAAPVLVVSGEKCVEAAARLLPGFVVMTWAGGDGNVWKADLRPLAGRKVTIWPDADPSGWDACQTLAQALHGHAAEVRVVDPAGQPKGWDVADAVADGWDRSRVIEWVKPRVFSWAPPAGPDDEPPIEPEPEPALQVDTVADLARATIAEIHAPPVKIDASLDTAADPEEDGLPEMYSEDNVALRFSQLFADDLRFVAPWGRWMRWRDQRWHHEDTLEVFDLSRKVCRSVAAYVRQDPELTPRQMQTVAGKYGQANTVASIERLAKADRRHAATIAQWDADPWLLNTPAGVIDLRTGSLRQGDRTAYMTKITHVAAGGACPTWHKFLHAATAGDGELIGFLQRMAGYALTGETRDHAMFFVYGTGGNGKGTFLNTLQWIMGDYAKAAPAEMFTERKHEAHTTELARLMGARLVTAQETEEGKRWAEAKIKALTGGDPVTARFMRQDDFEYIPQFKLVMTGNHKPGLRNVDEAIKRRLHMIPFMVTIPPEQRDTDLPAKLRAEAGGILQWAVEGCLAWQRGGLQAPAAVIAATSDYMEQQDVLGIWIEEACELDTNTSARRGDLYKSFKTWAEDAGEYVLPQKRWVAAMESRGFVGKLSRGIQYVQGLRVRRDTRKPENRPENHDFDLPL